jgi:prepilin-type N-terminal cleavage/methylation domain-containing protein
MSSHARKASGYSLIELLVVLAILGILAMVGVSMIGSRSGAAVRTQLDELEGVLTDARKVSIATGRDVAVDNWSNDLASPLIIACGDAALADSDLVATASSMLRGTSVTAVPYSQTVTVLYHQFANDVNQSRTRIVMPGTSDWATATGTTGYQNINTVAPFNGVTQPSFAGLVADANNFFNTVTTRLVISGTSHRFTIGNPPPGQTFIIQVVGTSPSAGPLPGSPAGLIVIQQNGSEVYKFYNPGTREGNGQWRRI